MNRRLESAVLHGVLIAGGVVTLFPLFWMLSASFMSSGEAATFPPHIVPHVIMEVVLSHHQASCDSITP